MNPWEYASKTRSEHAEQVALFMWASMAERYGFKVADDPEAYTTPAYIKTLFARTELGKQAYEPLPQLKWLHAIANHGAGYGRKSAGVKAGVADLFLPVPIINTQQTEHGQRVYHGLYIELKRLESQGKEAGRPSEKQLEFLQDMRNAGYKTAICYGWEEAKEEIKNYLGLDITRRVG